MTGEEKIGINELSNVKDVKFLNKTKDLIQGKTFFTKQINRTTIVSCTNKEKIKEYEKLFK
jgi:hypothetical protein